MHGHRREKFYKSKTVNMIFKKIKKEKLGTNWNLTKKPNYTLKSGEDTVEPTKDYTVCYADLRWKMVANCTVQVPRET